MHRLVLASTSPARKALLDQVGLAYDAVAPRTAEPLERFADPASQARAFAESKARAVFDRHPEAIVVGADQVLAFEGEAWGKPVDARQAYEQLTRLSGRTHALLTAVCVLAPGEAPWCGLAESRLTVRALTEAERRAYVATGEWEGCAGGYRLEGRGLALFELIEGDHTNVLGLPMPLLLTRLRALGVPLFGDAATLRSP
jgi:septum formation protein